MDLTLYNYYRSSASYRVRIALALKGLDYDYIPVQMVRDGGEQFQSDYRHLNPQSLVPTLVSGGEALCQSLAIIEYLEEVKPEPAILPGDPLMRAQVRAFAQTIACDIQPLVNLRVQKYLKQRVEVGASLASHWLSHWISLGLKSLEKGLQDKPQTAFCFGEQPGLADVFLVPQIFSAKRFNVETTPFHRLEAIYENCVKHPAFMLAAPQAQPDYE